MTENILSQLISDQMILRYVDFCFVNKVTEIQRALDVFYYICSTTLLIQSAVIC